MGSYYNVHRGLCCRNTSKKKKKRNTSKANSVPGKKRQRNRSRASHVPSTEADDRQSETVTNNKLGEDCAKAQGDGVTVKQDVFSAQQQEQQQQQQQENTLLRLDHDSEMPQLCSHETSSCDVTMSEVGACHMPTLTHSSAGDRQSVRSQTLDGSVTHRVALNSGLAAADDVVAPPLPASLVTYSGQEAAVDMSPVQSVGMSPVQSVGMSQVQSVGMSPVQSVGMSPVQSVGMSPVQSVGMSPLQSVDMVPMVQIGEQLVSLQMVASVV